MPDKGLNPLLDKSNLTKLRFTVRALLKVKEACVFKKLNFKFSYSNLLLGLSKYFSRFSMALGLKLESITDKERNLGKKLITLVILSPKVKLN
jgi:hypothetical protein